MIRKSFSEEMTITSRSEGGEKQEKGILGSALGQESTWLARGT